MVQHDLEFARKAILSGQKPLKIKKYRRSNLFWKILWLFAGMLFLMNLAGVLAWRFWLGVLFISPAILILIVARRMMVKSSDHDFGIALAELAILGVAIINGAKFIGLSLTSHLPAGLVWVVRAFGV